MRIVGLPFQIHVGQQTLRRLLDHDVRQRVCKHVVMAGGPMSTKCDLTLMAL